MVATAVVSPYNDDHKTTVPMQVANLSGEAVTLYKGSKIGQITQVDESIKVASVSQSLEAPAPAPISEISPHKQELL